MLGKIFVALFILIGSFGFAEAQKKDTQNILDYYKILPSNALDDENLKAKLSVEDIKNGYLRIEGWFEGYIEVALFRKENGAGTLAVGFTECGPVCGTELKFYEYIENEMKDVTEKVFPAISEDKVRAEFRRIVKDPNAEMVSFVYELPRIGRTIKILDDETGKLIYSLDWKKDRFVITK